MPLQNRHPKMNQLIDHAFQLMRFDDLLRQPSEQFTLAFCSSIFRKTSIHLKQRKPLTPKLQQLLVRVFEHFSNPVIVGSVALKWLEQERHPGKNIAFILYNAGCIIDACTQKGQKSSASLSTIAMPTISWLINQMMHYPLQSKNIGTSLHGLGRLAEHGLLQGNLDAQLITDLLERLKHRRDIDAQAIGNSLHGLGRLAEHGHLRGNIDGQLLSYLLEQLKQCRKLHGQEISNSLHSLGRLSEHGLLQGNLDGRLLTELLEQLQQCHELHAQEIGNSLHGLGRLAEHRQLQGNLDALLLTDLLKRLNDCRDLNAQAISTSLHGLGRLAEGRHLQGNLDGRVITNLLERLKHCHDIDAQAISNSLHGLGRLAEHGQLRGNIDGRLLSDLLERFNHCRGINAQAIANTLHGLGRLAEHGKLQGNINSQLFTELLDRLKHCPSLNAQAIGNSLHGLGRLAEHGQLQENLDDRVLAKLLELLNHCRDIKAQHIGNSLHALGRLAESGQWQGNLDGQLINDLLKRLKECQDIDIQAISCSLHGLGRLAEHGQLQDNIDGRLFIDLLARLNHCRDLNAQEISNSLYGLGHLAEHGQLLGHLDDRLFTELLKRLNHCRGLNAQAISNSLYGLGRLAEHGQWLGNLDSGLFTDLLELLNHCLDINGQAISTSLHGLGRMAEHGLLQSKLDDRFIKDLLGQLKQCSDIKDQHISNSLHALGRLAEHELWQGTLDGLLLTDLLKLLKQSGEIKAQHISNSLYGLGRLTEHGQLQDNIDDRLITDLLERLQHCSDIDAQAIANSVHGLGRLIRHQNRATLIGSNAIASLVTQFFALTPNHIECDQMLFGLSTFAYQGLNPHLLLSQEQVKMLMNTALSGTYVHPCRAALLLHSLISFRFHTPELNGVFERLMDAVECISAKRLPPRVLRQLQQDKDALSFAPRWQARVQQYIMPPVARQRAAPVFFSSPSPQSVAGQRRPRPSIEHVEPPRKRRALSVQTANTDSEWILASRNALFQAISNENLTELRALLDLIAEPRYVSSGTRTRTATTNRTHTGMRPRGSAEAISQSQAEQRVNLFLQNTSVNALRRLISQSSSKYFISLLEACSVHGRFVLAKQHYLNLIIIHLPFDSLSSFIAALLPLQLYRDHQALLALLDALTIRLDQNPDEHEAIVTLQKQLINRGLEFHRECRHHHVVARLEIRKQAINNNTMVLETTEELTTTSPVLQVGRQEPLLTAPMPVRSPEIIVATPSVAPLHSPQQRSVNPSYLYTAEDIDALLHIRLNARPNIQILAATHLRTDAPANLIEVLHQFIEHQDNTTTPCTALVPIEVGEHWIGVKLVFNNNKITQMVYFNSMETEGSPHRYTIMNLLHSAQLLAPSFRSFTNDNELRQLNSFDCGPLLIENMRGDCCNNYWRKPLSNEALQRLAGIIRQKHFDLLENENPLHFETFKNQDNEQTPAVSVQLNRYNQAVFFNNNNTLVSIAGQRVLSEIHRTLPN